MSTGGTVSNAEGVRKQVEDAHDRQVIRRGKRSRYMRESDEVRKDR